MTHHNTAASAWLHLIRRIRLHGKRHSSRVGDMLEVVGLSLTIEDTRYPRFINKVRNINPAYQAIEVLWMLNGSAKVDMLLPYAPSYKANYCDGDEAWGAYGPRILETWHDTIAELKASGDSRRAYIPIWNAADCNNMKRDLPCCVGMQFLIRNGRLHMLAYCRSSDVWLGLPNDMYTFIAHQHLMAYALGVDVGPLTLNFGSVHIYDRYADRSEAALDCLTQPIISYWDNLPLDAAILSDAVANERSIRQTGELAHMTANDMLSEFNEAFYAHWSHDDTN